jgi:hypothetical protein
MDNDNPYKKNDKKDDLNIVIDELKDKIDSLMISTYITAFIFIVLIICLEVFYRVVLTSK